VFVSSVGKQVTQTGRRAIVPFVLLALALSFIVLAISETNYHIMIFGPENSGLPIQVEIISKQGEGSWQGGLPEKEQDSKPVVVQLSVTVMENTSQGSRFIRGVPINVTIVRLLEPDEIGLSDRQAVSEERIEIAYGVTNRAGTVAFQLPPSNYTVFAKHLGVLANFSVTLLPSNPKTSLRWVFHNGYETPVVVQMNDVNTDGWISPGETIAVFYRNITVQKPHRITLAISGQKRLLVDLEILRFSVFAHGVYVVLSPLQPIFIGDLGLESAILIRTVRYEVSTIP